MNLTVASRPFFSGVLWLSLAAVSIAALTTGAVTLSLSDIVTALGAQLGLAFEVEPLVEAVFFDIRLPRVVLGTLVGAGLAVSGAALQGLFRNPLVDPGLMGATSGAAAGAALAIVFSGAILGVGFGSTFLVPALAFAGALIATLLVYRGASSNGRTSVTALILLGVGINAIAGVLIGTLTFIADDTALRSLAFWNLGSLGAASWETNAVVAVGTLLPLFFLLRTARPLNALSLGEREASLLGIEVESLKTRIAIVSSLCVGVGVCASGSIGFVGLVVPQALRLVTGPDHRVLLPTSALSGAILVVGADLLARVVVAPVELPIGLVTSALGAPVFVALVLRRARAGAFN